VLAGFLLCFLFFDPSQSQPLGIIGARLIRYYPKHLLGHDRPLLAKFEELVKRDRNIPSTMVYHGLSISKTKLADDLPEIEVPGLYTKYQNGFNSLTHGAFVQTVDLGHGRVVPLGGVVDNNHGDPSRSLRAQLRRDPGLREFLDRMQRQGKHPFTEDLFDPRIKLNLEHFSGIERLAGIDNREIRNMYVAVMPREINSLGSGNQVVREYTGFHESEGWVDALEERRNFWGGDSELLRTLDPWMVDLLAPDVEGQLAAEDKRRAVRQRLYEQSLETVSQRLEEHRAERAYKRAAWEQQKKE